MDREPVTGPHQPRAQSAHVQTVLPVGSTSWPRSDRAEESPSRWACPGSHTKGSRSFRGPGSHLTFRCGCEGAGRPAGSCFSSSKVDGEARAPSPGTWVLLRRKGRPPGLGRLLTAVTRSSGHAGGLAGNGAGARSRPGPSQPCAGQPAPGTRCGGGSEGGRAEVSGVWTTGGPPGPGEGVQPV